MNQISLSFEETIHIVSKVARNLGHPQSVCVTGNPSDLHTSCRDFNEEKNDKSLQAGWRPHFDREEIRADDLFPMSRDKFFPRRFSNPLWCGLNAVLLQNVRDGFERQHVPRGLTALPVFD